MEERLGEMRKGRRERMRKGGIVSSSPQGMTSCIKIWVFKRIGERAKRARHSQVCSIENHGYILLYIVRANFVLITRKEGGA